MRISCKSLLIQQDSDYSLLNQKLWSLFTVTWVSFMILLSPHLTNKEAFAKSAEQKSASQTSVNNKPLKEGSN